MADRNDAPANERKIATLQRELARDVKTAADIARLCECRDDALAEARTTLAEVRRLMDTFDECVTIHLSAEARLAEVMS